MSKFNYYIAERNELIARVKMVGRCNSLKNAIDCKNIFKKQEPQIDFMVLKEVEE